MISILVPVLNESQSLQQLHLALNQILHANNLNSEIIFIDDGSTDSSWKVISGIATHHKNVKGIKLRSNFGKTAALNTGFKLARGEIIFTIDADLQDDPQDIPKMIDKLNQGLDVVSGWRKKRHDKWHKVLASKAFNRLTKTITGIKINDINCGLKCYRKEVINSISLHGDLHRFIPIIAAEQGWKIDEYIVNHHPRKHGSSKYSSNRISKGLLDLLTIKLITRYKQRPQHLLGAIGVTTLLVGITTLVLLTAWWALSRLDASTSNDLHLHQRAIFYYAITATIIGTQFISVGLLSELINSYNKIDDSLSLISEKNP